MTTKVDSFYNPISTTGYLTPLQRKKLREKRKIELSDSPQQNDQILPPKSKRSKKSTSKPKKSKVVPKKPVKKTPNSKSIASDLLVKSNTSDPKDRKFFKTRSPQHLKKAKFRPMSYKRSRLEFGNVVSSDGPLKDCSEEVLTESNHEEVKEVEKEVFLDGLLEFEWPSDEDLKRRQMKAREELRSSQVQKENVKEPEPEESATIETTPKLYPIFLKTKSKKPAETETKRPSLNKGPTFVKETLSGGVQTYIDAGQKEVGAKVCSECGMIYTIAQEQDEKLHTTYHNTYFANLKFPGWLKENVVGSYIDGRIILINEKDKHSKLKKVQDVLLIANRDLGFTSASFPTKPNVVFLLFISNEKRVCGCLVAEEIESACPVGSEAGNWYASTTPVEAVCGVNRIWVARDFRRKGVASRMLNCLRQNFLYGHIVELKQLAFTDPTPDGRQFAAKYTKNENFLVYK